jgi:hypothetical protein
VLLLGYCLAGLMVDLGFCLAGLTADCSVANCIRVEMV